MDGAVDAASKHRDQIIVGDIILLKAPAELAENSVLQAGGVVLRECCHLACPPVDYHNCEFVVTVQQQYSAALDFKEFKRKKVPTDAATKTLHKVKSLLTTDCTYHVAP